MIHYTELCRRQIVWYRANGRFPKDRIATDRDGVAYVIGDWSWNRMHPDKFEVIEKDSGFANCEWTETTGISEP